MKVIYGENLDHVLAFVTGICTTLSLVGSLLVIIAYYIAKTRTNPRAAKLIRNLAIADFIWFSAVFIESIFWIFTGPDGEVGEVPDGLCYVFSPLTTVSRVSSLLWTSVVAFDVLESVTKRSWFLTKETNNACGTNSRYFLFVYGFSLPGGIATIIVHSWKQSGFGCGAGYERIGIWYEVLLYELIPIFLGFCLNLYVFWKVRLRMAKRAFPLSVRKRRRRVMFNYIRVCIICWTPMMAFYVLEMSGVQSPLFNVISRGLLYLTGFFNFLVFGMQDMYLKRSMQLCLQRLCCGMSFGGPVGQMLLNKHLEKTVMFADENKLNADVIKDKKSMYRNHRLSREDKKALYKLRPDLNLKGTSIATEEEDPPTAPVAAVSWDSGGSDSSSVHSVADLGAVVFGGPRSPDSASRSANRRPATPKAPSRSSAHSDQDMEWDIEDQVASPVTPLTAAAAPVECAGRDEWISADPTEALLSKTACESSPGYSISFPNGGDDNSSSGDEADEEDEQLIEAMLAVQSDTSKSWASPNTSPAKPAPYTPPKASAALESSTRDSNEDDEKA